MFRSTRNFYNKDGKPRMFPARVGKKQYWNCKLVDKQGQVLGFGTGATMETAYRAFLRNKKWRFKGCPSRAYRGR